MTEEQAGLVVEAGHLAEDRRHAIRERAYSAMERQCLGDSAVLHQAILGPGPVRLRQAADLRKPVDAHAERAGPRIA